MYCGRAFGKFQATPVGSPTSVRGKPCPVCRKVHFPHVEPSEAGSSVQCYRRWLNGRIQANDLKIVDFLVTLPDDAVLGCWCIDLDDATQGPEQCHCEVVAKAARYLKAKAGK